MKKLILILLTPIFILGKTPDEDNHGFESKEQFLQVKAIYDEACKKFNINPERGGSIYVDHDLVGTETLAYFKLKNKNIYINPTCFWQAASPLNNFDQSRSKEDYSYGLLRHTIFHEVVHKQQRQNHEIEEKQLELTEKQKDIVCSKEGYLSPDCEKLIEEWLRQIDSIYLKKNQETGERITLEEKLALSETDADSRGAVACGCFICVERAFEGHFKSPRGYLGLEEVQPIINEHKSQNRLCETHRRIVENDCLKTYETVLAAQTLLSKNSKVVSNKTLSILQRQSKRLWRNIQPVNSSI